MRGDRVDIASLTAAMDHPPRGPDPRSCVPNSATDELSKDSSGQQTARNGYVAQFSLVRSNASPFFQTVNAIDEIFRTNVSRAHEYVFKPDCNLDSAREWPLACCFALPGARISGLRRRGNPLAPMITRINGGEQLQYPAHELWQSDSAYKPSKMRPSRVRLSLLVYANDFGRVVRKWITLEEVRRSI